MIRRRFAFRFALQLALAGALLVLLAIAIIAWMLGRFQEIEIKRNFAPLGISKLISEADVDANGLIVDEAIFRRLQADGGWLQSLDAQGNVLQSFNSPPGLPDRYKPGQLMDYWIGSAPYPYRLGLWIQEKDGHLYTLLYGARSPTEDALGSLMDQGEIAGAEIVLPVEAATFLGEHRAWIEVLDEEGAVTASWHRPDTARSVYTLQDLALGSNGPGEDGAFMDTRYDEETGLTWVLHVVPDGQPSGGFSLETEAEVLIAGVVAFLCAALLVFAALSFWYARRFGRPIVHLLSRIERLGHGVYDEDTTPEKGKRSKKAFRRDHRLFREVADSIDSLGVTLRAAKEAESQAQRNRDEWIAGVTHDMKTPLASIQGYAHMLETTKYDWTEEEIRQFASTILDKSEYMVKLINDLSLTFRLRSGDVSVALASQDIRELLPEAVRRATLHPTFGGDRVSCSVPNEPIYAPVYAPWFDRIVDNIVANGLIHNPSGTRMEIVLSSVSDGGWQIDFRDDGQGMEEETIGRLFERYYRGTDTDSSAEGSGLGMAVTKMLVQAMGGSIQVDSKRGEGTTIRLRWNASTIFSGAAS